MSFANGEQSQKALGVVNVSEICRMLQIIAGPDPQRWMHGHRMQRRHPARDMVEQRRKP